MKHFNAKLVDGKIPLVLVPKHASLFSFCVQIPSGMYVRPLYYDIAMQHHEHNSLTHALCRYCYI